MERPGWVWDLAAGMLASSTSLKALIWVICMPKCHATLFLHHDAVHVSWKGLCALQVMLVPEANLYPVPDEVTDKVAAQFSVSIPIRECYQHHRVLQGGSHFCKEFAAQCRTTQGCPTVSEAISGGGSMSQYDRGHAGDHTDCVCPNGGSRSSLRGQVAGTDSRGLISGAPDNQPGQA